MATPRKEKVGWPLESLVHRRRQAGVNLRTGWAPTLEEIQALHPYAILDATGGRPSLPASIQGVGESPLVCTPVEIITGQLDLREESIVVVGSGMTGLRPPRSSPTGTGTTPSWCWRPPRVALGSMAPTATGSPGCWREQRGLSHQPHPHQGGAGPDLVCGQPDRGGVRLPLRPGGAGPGHTPTRPYALEDLQALGGKVFRVGDAAQSGQVWDAVHDGYHAARSL